MMSLKKALAVATKKENRKYYLLVFIPILIFAFKSVLTSFYNWFRNLFNSSGAVISTEQAKLKVEQLQTCFNQILGDNLNCVKPIFAGLTSSDYYKLKLEFGSVYRNPITGEVTSPFFPFASALNLTEWLANELDTEDLNALKMFNPNLPI